MARNNILGVRHRLTSVFSAFSVFVIHLWDIILLPLKICGRGFDCTWFTNSSSGQLKLAFRKGTHARGCSFVARPYFLSGKCFLIPGLFFVAALCSAQKLVSPQRHPGFPAQLQHQAVQELRSLPGIWQAQLASWATFSHSSSFQFTLGTYRTALSTNQRFKPNLQADFFTCSIKGWFGFS